MSGLPFDATLWAVVPVPAWSALMDPDAVAYGDVDAEAFVAAVAHELRPLEARGFELLPRDTWELSEALALGAVRDDDTAVLVAELATSSFVLVVPGPFEERSAAGIVAAALSNEFAAYGSFPLTTDPAEHVRAFVETFAGALARQPVDVAALQDAMTADVQRRATPLAERYYRAQLADARTAGQDEAIAHWLDALGPLVPLTADEQRELDTARARIAAQPPILVRGQHESYREWTVRRAETMNAARDGGDWFAYRRAYELFYSAEFWALTEALRDGDDGAVEDMIQFLEADPWCFRSGYAKARIMSYLPRHDLSGDRGARLEQVLLRIVDRGGRVEQREANRLARAVQRASLRRALHDRITGADRGIARRALWMLVAMRRPRLSPDERAVVRELIVDAARDEDRWYSATGWVRRLLPMVAIDEWQAEMSRRAVEGAGTDAAALRLLGEFRPGPLTDGYRERLGEILLDAVRAGGDESWLEGIAPHARSEEVEAALEALRQSPDPDVARRAWWAVRAILLHMESGP